MFPCSELRNVLYLFKCSKGDAQCMEEMANGDLEGVQSMSRDAALACAVFLGFELDIDDKMERMDMCRMFSNFKRKYRAGI